MVHVLYMSAPLTPQNKAVIQNLTVDMLDKNSLAGMLLPTTGTDFEPDETTPHRQTTPSLSYLRHCKLFFLVRLAFRKKHLPFSNFLDTDQKFKTL